VYDPGHVDEKGVGRRSSHRTSRRVVSRDELVDKG